MQGYGRLDRLDGLSDEFLPENLPAPVLARDVPLWRADAASAVRARGRQLERELRAERRAEARVTALFAAFVVVVGGVTAVVDWALAVSVVHP